MDTLQINSCKFEGIMVLMALSSCQVRSQRTKVKRSWFAHQLAKVPVWFPLTLS